MATDPVITERDDLDRQLQSLIPSGRTPQPYTQGVLGVNLLLHRWGVPLPRGFGEVVRHNVTMVETRQISSVTGHLQEVVPLAQSSVDHYRSGNYRMSAICLGGALGNLFIAPMLSGSAQKSRMNIGKE